MDHPLDLDDAAPTGDLFDDAARCLASSRNRSHCIERLPAAGRLLVTGDLHENPVHWRKILHLARLEDGPDRHLLLQEIIHGDRLVNGMDFSYRMLGRVADLVRRFPDQVHPILANHEMAQMTGKGVSKGGGDSVQRFNEALEYAFGEAWEQVAQAICRFIRALPLALVSERGLFCAHSLPASHMMTRFDPAVLERDLREEDYLGPTGAAYLMVWGRGHTEEQVQALAQRWGVRLFCLGHAHVETGIEAPGPGRVVLNSDHERGAVLPVDLAATPLDAHAAVEAAIPLSAIGVPG